MGLVIALGHYNARFAYESRPPSIRRRAFTNLAIDKQSSRLASD